MATTIPKHKRIRLSQKKYIELKLKVLERDQCCVLRGCSAPTELHHVIFRSQGGDDSMQNCVMLCHDCHEVAHGPDSRDIRVALLQYLDQVNEVNNGTTK